MPRAKKHKNSKHKNQQSAQDDPELESLATHSFEETKSDETNNFISRATEFKARDLKADRSLEEDPGISKRTGSIDGISLGAKLKLKAKPKAKNGVEVTGGSSKKLVFILDDDIGLTEVYRARLEVEGYDVVVKHNGEDGIVWLAENKADVAIIDSMLPKYSGITVIETILAQKPKFKTPFIFVSGLDRPEYSKKAKKLGARSYLVKSKASISEMVDEVERALSSKSKKPRRLKKPKK